MKILFWFLLIMLFVFLYWLLRFVVKRLRLLYQIKRFCLAHGFHYECKCIFSLIMPSNRNSKSAVLIHTKETIYHIRVFGLLRRGCEVHFWNLQQYSVEWYWTRRGYIASIPVGQRAVRRRVIGGFDQVESKNRTVVPILLFSPAKGIVRLTQTQINRMEYLQVGDQIGDAIFSDKDYLFRFIDKKEQIWHYE